MELMSICLDQFYRFVHGGLCQRIPESILGQITLAVSSFTHTVVDQYLYDYHFVAISQYKLL